MRMAACEDWKLFHICKSLALVLAGGLTKEIRSGALDSGCALLRLWDIGGGAIRDCNWLPCKQPGLGRDVNWCLSFLLVSVSFIENARTTDVFLLPLSLRSFSLLNFSKARDSRLRACALSKSSSYCLS